MTKTQAIAATVGVAFVAATAVTMHAIAYRVASISATQDNILRTLQAEGIIENLQIGK